MWGSFELAPSGSGGVEGFVARVQTSLLQFAFPWTEASAGARESQDHSAEPDGDRDAEADEDGLYTSADSSVGGTTRAAAAIAPGSDASASIVGTGTVSADREPGSGIESSAMTSRSLPASTQSQSQSHSQSPYTPPDGLRDPRRPGEALTHAETHLLISTLIRCFQSLEHPGVRRAVLRHVSLPVWRCACPGVVARELRRHPALQRPWSTVCSKSDASPLGQLPPPLYAGPATKPSRAAEPAAAALVSESSPDASSKRASKRPRRSSRRKASTGSDSGADTDAATADQSAASTSDAAAGTSKAAGSATPTVVTLAEVQPWLQERFLASLVRMAVLAIEACDTQLEAASAKVESASGGDLPHLAPHAGLCKIVERLMELFVDLLAQFPTRRFSRLLIEDSKLLLIVRGSELVQAPRGRLTGQLAALLDYYLGFPIDDQTSKPVDPDEAAENHYERLVTMQRLVHRHEHLRDQAPDLALAALGPLSRRSVLARHLDSFEDPQLVELAHRLQLLPAPALMQLPALVRFVGEPDVGIGGAMVLPQARCAPLAAACLPRVPTRDLAAEVLLDWHRARKSQLQAVNGLPLYPTEELIWDANRVPFAPRKGGGARAASASGGSTSRLAAQPANALALPKLNLQYLTFFDMMLRSFHLYRLEAAYEIRQDLVDAVRRCAPRTVVSQGPTGDMRSEVRFDGWSRRAVTLQSFKVTSVGRPKVGEEHPSHVSAELRYDLARYAHHIRREWSSLREHDVVFLVTVRPAPKKRVGESDGSGGLAAAAGGAPGRPASLGDDVEDPEFAERWGVLSVRGAEVTAHLDEDGKNFNDPSNVPPGGSMPQPRGTGRVLRLRLDAAQYHMDLQSGEESSKGSAAEAYTEFNLVVRRDAKENNFRAVLESLRDIMNAHAMGQGIPTWLQNLLLGYGDPAAATPAKLPGHPSVIEVGDTFLNAAHARECLVDPSSGGAPTVLNSDGVAVEAGDPAELLLRPPFRVTTSSTGVTVQQHKKPAAGPYPSDEPPRNPVPFTHTQVRAIQSGLCPGVTIVVGPPGTGKSDVAVQIVSTLYRTRPQERILLVTHSNQALNDLFQKIAGRDVDGRHLLRLGRGERDLDSDEDFSKWGRVDEALRRRHILLQKVGRLAVSLGMGVPQEGGGIGIPEYTCETAEYFRLQHVQARLEQFWSEIDLVRAKAEEEALAEGADMSEQDKAQAVFDAFPFTRYFSDVPGGLTKAAAGDAGTGAPLFSGESFELDLESARSCERHLAHMFEELQSYRAFELLRSQRQRTDYMLVKEAKVVAMTCTHAALTRRHLLKLGFEYDTIVMEEAAQVLEAETLLPMFMQASQRHGSSGFAAAGGAERQTSRLKRIVLIGDHHQLPPVIKCRPLQRYAKLDQSLFTRLVRLGFPYIMLESQGRARPTIAETYHWRYGGLAPLPRVLTGSYLYGNAGFCHTSQFVNVPDFMEQGESTPTPYFYQNLGEAEFVVAVFQYMRLLGYPAERITMLSTYNGQVSLLRDVVAKRCAPFPQFGEPRKIETVDKYQGQQNDFVLLSLVRTRAVGHVRDVRRLVVALSRARLGLYVFGRQELFESCVEIGPALNVLLSKPSVLQLLPGEVWPTQRPESITGAEDVSGGASETSGSASAGDAPNVSRVTNATEMGLIVHALNLQKRDETAASVERARMAIRAMGGAAQSAHGGEGVFPAESLEAKALESGPKAPVDGQVSMDEDN